MNGTWNGSVWRRIGAVLPAALAVFGLSVVAARPARAAGVAVGPVLAGLTGQGDFGTIRGRLVWGGPQAPPVKNLVPNKDEQVCGAKAPIPDNKLVVDPTTKGIRYGFAYLAQPKGQNPEAVKALLAKAASVDIDQKNCEFIPYCLAMHQDQALVFKSSDPVNHNVHLSPFTNAPFNVILAPKGQMEKKLVAENRVIPLSCDIHGWMKGYIMVFDHPFFDVTTESGSFEIKGVPAGEQNLVVWQAATGFVTPNLRRGMPVTVKAGEVTDVGEIKLDPAKVKD
jgi:hypothetical protein